MVPKAIAPRANVAPDSKKSRLLIYFASVNNWAPNSTTQIGISGRHSLFVTKTEQDCYPAGGCSTTCYTKTFLIVIASNSAFRSYPRPQLFEFRTCSDLSLKSEPKGAIVPRLSLLNQCPRNCKSC